MQTTTPSLRERVFAHLQPVTQPQAIALPLARIALIVLSEEPQQSQQFSLIQFEKSFSSCFSSLRKLTVRGDGGHFMAGSLEDTFRGLEAPSDGSHIRVCSVEKV